MSMGQLHANFRVAHSSFSCMENPPIEPLTGVMSCMETVNEGGATYSLMTQYDNKKNTDTCLLRKNDRNKKGQSHLLDINVKIRKSRQVWRTEQKL